MILLLRALPNADHEYCQGFDRDPDALPPPLPEYGPAMLVQYLLPVHLFIQTFMNYEVGYW